MDKSKHKKLAVLMAVTVALFGVSSVKANMALSSSSATYTYVREVASSLHLENLLYRQGQDGSWNGDLNISYDYSSLLASVKYSGGTTALETCLILADDEEGTDIPEICDWNGTGPIGCEIKGHEDGCNDVEVYGNCKVPPPSTKFIPEPTTTVAAACLLMPFALNTVWLLRRQKSF